MPSGVKFRQFCPSRAIWGASPKLQGFKAKKFHILYGAALLFEEKALLIGGLRRRHARRAKGMKYHNIIRHMIWGGSLMGLIACQTLPAPDKTAQGPAPLSEGEAVTPQTPQYEKLVYGAEKPLVCSDVFPAEGRFQRRPNLQLMWENYLYDRPEGIWGEIGGRVEVNGNLPLDQGRWTNACTVRLSHMLNKAGHKIPRAKDNKTVSGGNKDQYYYRVADIEAYLKDVFGAPDLNLDDGSANSFDLPPRPGIILMDFPNGSYTGHITIWNGAGTVDGANIGGYRVLFWELPCFLPEGREEKVVGVLSSKRSARGKAP